LIAVTYDDNDWLLVVTLALANAKTY